MRTNNPHIRGCDCVNHRIPHPVQGLERGRGGGEVRVMTHYGYDPQYCRIWNVTSVQIIGKRALRVVNR
jgi:hypothetical protein